MFKEKVKIELRTQNVKLSHSKKEREKKKGGEEKATAAAAELVTVVQKGQKGDKGRHTHRDSGMPMTEAAEQVAEKQQGRRITTKAAASPVAYRMYYSADIPLTNYSNSCIFENVYFIFPKKFP